MANISPQISQLISSKKEEGDSMEDSMLNKWDYSGVDSVCYSDDDQVSYKKAADFLGPANPVEDWGGGTGWAKRFFTGKYKNIDGSPHKGVDVIANLIKYTSSVDNILLRQVLELNTDWRVILENVKKSFTKKFCLVVFTPLALITHIGDTEKVVSATGVVREDEHILIFFNKQDILDYFPSSEFKVSEEVVKNGQGYGEDWVLYVQRI